MWNTDVPTASEVNRERLRCLRASLDNRPASGSALAAALLEQAHLVRTPESYHVAIDEHRRALEEWPDDLDLAQKMAQALADLRHLIFGPDQETERAAWIEAVTWFCGLPAD